LGGEELTQIPLRYFWGFSACCCIYLSRFRWSWYGWSLLFVHLAPHAPWRDAPCRRESYFFIPMIKQAV